MKTHFGILWRVLLAIVMSAPGLEAQGVSFLGRDSLVKGDWMDLYGRNGRIIATRESICPVGVTLALQGQTDFTWATDTTDSRALRSYQDNSRIASCWYGERFEMSLSMPSGGRISLYCVDWDGIGRSQTIELRSSIDDNLLDSRDLTNFSQGSYLRWNISGDVKIVVINKKPGANAVIGGIFFDPPKNDPAWWSSSEPPVIDPLAVPENYSLANIGQGKWMAKNAYETLYKVLPGSSLMIDPQLIGDGKILQSWNAPVDANGVESHYSPLAIGQLKAIATPLYDHLAIVAPQWVANALSGNLTYSGGVYPWTDSFGDDDNKSPAAIGQLKAVFSLDFTADSEAGVDSDGLPDLWETAVVNANGADAWSSISQIHTGNVQRAAEDTGLTPPYWNDDTNANGIPDGYEIFHFGSIGASYPWEDFDNDGFSNEVEMTLGMNPSAGYIESNIDGVEIYFPN